MGDTYAKPSFSGWPWAPDARKRDNLEVPVAPRYGGIPLFASPALLIQENLDLLMATRCQRHGEAVHNVSNRLPKTEPEPKKRRLSRMLLSSSIFDVFWIDFDAKGTRNVHEIVRNTYVTVLEPRPEVKNGVSTAPARADLGSGPS